MYTRFNIDPQNHKSIFVVLHLTVCGVLNIIQHTMASQSNSTVEWLVSIKRFIDNKQNGWSIIESEIILRIQKQRKYGILTWSLMKFFIYSLHQWREKKKEKEKKEIHNFLVCKIVHKDQGYKSPDSHDNTFYRQIHTQTHTPLLLSACLKSHLKKGS